MSDIRKILKTYWGYDEFRSLQEDIIYSVISGKDTLALMPTGGGKSITYQVAALAMEGVCIVITPLIALMKDQVEELKKRKLPGEAVYTGMTTDQMESVMNKSIYGKIKFLYISPERLASENFRAKLKMMKICLFAVDEAHCISQWGYDFRPSYLRIAEMREAFPDVPILALTATATPGVVEDIQNQLNFKQHHVLSKSFRRDNISYVVRNVNDKLGELYTILSKLPASAIVYVRRRATTEELANFLCTKGIQSDFYHAGLSSLQREKKQENWKNDVIPVIVATNAFGMGIDKPDVRIVVHFDIPDSPEAYFQEAGRAGRDGQRAYAVLLYNTASLTALKTRITKGFPEKTYIKEVYQALANYFQLEEGDGSGRAFEFDTDTFVKNFNLDYMKAMSAIKVLQVGGYLECTTDIHARSRICFLVLRDRLYDINPGSKFLDHLLELVLRTYSGIFVQYTFIDEQYLADKLGVGRQEVYEGLVSFAKRKIVSYIPGNDRPYIVYHQPRMPISYVQISREAYEDRKLSYADKINRMVAYAEETEQCRQLFLMKYFGQQEKEPCGVCDVCLSRKKQNRKPNSETVDQAILDLLALEDQELRVLANAFEYTPEQVIKRLRMLLDDGKVFYKTATLLALKRK